MHILILRIKCPAMLSIGKCRLENWHIGFMFLWFFNLISCGQVFNLSGFGLSLCLLFLNLKKFCFYWHGEVGAMMPKYENPFDRFFFYYLGLNTMFIVFTYSDSYVIYCDEVNEIAHLSHAKDL